MNKPLVIILIIISAITIGALVVYVNSRGGLKASVSGNITQELSKFDSPKNNQEEKTYTMPEITELKIEDINEGTGSAVKSGDIAEVNYLGTLLNGQKFDSSYDRSQTFSFTVGGGEVIEGWDKGLVGMKIGGKRKLIIPSDMAYGPQGVGGIPPNSPLIFEIELVSIK